MSATSKIEWTDRTWNPVRGCSIVSPGCVNCYAMKQAHRFSGEGKPYHGLTKQTKAGPQWTGRVLMYPHLDDEPLQWREPARVFVNSMSDLFHQGVHSAFIETIFYTMAEAHWHTFQILTKRPKRMRDEVRYLAGRLLADGHRWPLPNVWLGVSVENQKYADKRIPPLLQTPAAVRFISAEPLLGPVDIEPYASRNVLGVNDASGGLDWVIVGGESGPGARPFDLAWARSIVQQCKAAGVPCFVKQLGGVPTMPDADWRRGVPGNSGSVYLLNHRNAKRVPPDYVPLKFFDKKGGNPDEWPTDLQVREFPC